MILDQALPGCNDVRALRGSCDVLRTLSEVATPVRLDEFGPADGRADLDSQQVRENWRWEVKRECADGSIAGVPRWEPEALSEDRRESARVGGATRHRAMEEPLVRLP